MHFVHSWCRWSLIFFTLKDHFCETIFIWVIIHKYERHKSYIWLWKAHVCVKSCLSFQCTWMWAKFVLVFDSSLVELCINMIVFKLFILNVYPCNSGRPCQADAGWSPPPPKKNVEFLNLPLKKQKKIISEFYSQALIFSCLKREAEI